MPRNTTLVPLTVTSLEEVDVTIEGFLSAKLVPSDRPGYIAIEVTAEVEADVSYEDTDAIGTPGKAGYESKTFRQEVNHTKVVSTIVYIAVGNVQAACNTLYYNSLKPTAQQIEGAPVRKMIEGTPPRKLLEAMPVSDSPAPLGLGAWPSNDENSVFEEALKRFVRSQEERLMVAPPRYGKNAFFDGFTAPTATIRPDGVVRWDQASDDKLPVVRTIQYIGATVPLPNQYVGPYPDRDHLEQIRIADCHL